MLNRATRHWIEEVCGVGSTIRSARPLLGGVSSSIHEVVLAGGTIERVIVRQITEPRDDPAEGQWEIVNEARILQHCDGNAGAPRWLARDPTGERCGFPTSLQTRLRGRPMVNPKDRSRWAKHLSDATASITKIEADTSKLTDYQPWWPTSTDPPTWTRDTSRWSHVCEALRQQLPDHARTALIHRDLHPANVLFWRGAWSGTVDWTHGCRGPIEVDISRCRVQIAFLTDMHTADLYLDRCRPLVDGYDRRWDAVAAIELSPWTQDIAETYGDIGSTVTAEQISTTLDQFVVG